MSHWAWAAWGAAAGLILPTAACAGAWPAPQGETQVIFKYEAAAADSALDLNGGEVAIAARRDDGVSIFFEHGLTNTLTLQGKAGYSAGHDGGFDYSGAAPTEIGLRQQLWRRKHGVVSLYAGVVLAGEGHNAGYAPLGAGEGDLEIRLLAGSDRKLFGRPAFREVQVARLFRRGLPNEWRMDTTTGVRVSEKWMVMAQTYAGRAEADGFTASWLKAEASLVRDVGNWKLQAGWRQTLSGRETPVEGGPVLAVWRRF
ncbi:MAG: hypothetical protein ACXW3D_05200 [Caulobacteraceae bacterium]